MGALLLNGRVEGCSACCLLHFLQSSLDLAVCRPAPTHPQTLAAAWRTASAASPPPASAGAGSATGAAALAVTSGNKPTCGLGKQVSLLFGRSLRQVRRAGNWAEGAVVLVSAEACSVC